VELPRAESQLARVDVHDADLAAVASAGTRRRAKVLYVEDNLSNVALMQRILARHEHIELILAMSGGLAIDLARLHRPDLVLLDLHLPDIPGEEVLARLRQDPSCREIPVVVLSADATPGHIDRLVSAGAYAYLTKPLDLRPFMALLDEVLQHTKEAA
jgi:CheY-like chemotaxis protein